MNSENKHQETLIYVVLWGLLFSAPVLSLYIRTVNGHESFNWSEVLMVWRQLAVFLAFFLVHNYLLAPLLIYRQRRALYFSVITALFAAFVVYQCSNHPDGHPRKRPFHDAPPRSERFARPGNTHQPTHTPPPFDDIDDNRRPPEPPRDFDDAPHGNPAPPKGADPLSLSNDATRHHPPLFIGQHDIVSAIILILMLLANLGVKLYFKQRRDADTMAKLEKQNLEQQLEYLKYQINPHFLMNTLNNIHALVDIDAERAKDTILELSKIMRFVLYEGNKQTVPLGRELTFLEDYIKLMQLRYNPDKVRVTVSLPDSLPDREIPPLLLITFVENAFKHGVSYRQQSFIDIQVTCQDDKLTFTCVNSVIPATEDNHGGVGLKNVRQRLDLIYGNRYTLDIDAHHLCPDQLPSSPLHPSPSNPSPSTPSAPPQSSEAYSVSLTIPL